MLELTGPIVLMILCEGMNGAEVEAVTELDPSKSSSVAVLIRFLR